MGNIDVEDARGFAARLRDAERHVAQFVVLDDGHIDLSLTPPLIVKQESLNFQFPDIKKNIELLFR